MIKEWEKLEELIGDCDISENFVPIFCLDHQDQGYKNYYAKLVDSNQAPLPGKKGKKAAVAVAPRPKKLELITFGANEVEGKAIISEIEAAKSKKSEKKIKP